MIPNGKIVSQNHLNIRLLTRKPMQHTDRSIHGIPEVRFLELGLVSEAAVISILLYVTNALPLEKEWCSSSVIALTYSKIDLIGFVLNLMHCHSNKMGSIFFLLHYLDTVFTLAVLNIRPAIFYQLSLQFTWNLLKYVEQHCYIYK